LHEFHTVSWKSVNYYIDALHRISQWIGTLEIVGLIQNRHDHELCKISLNFRFINPRSLVGLSVFSLVVYQSLFAPVGSVSRPIHVVASYLVVFSFTDNIGKYLMSVLFCWWPALATLSKSCGSLCLAAFRLSAPVFLGTCLVNTVCIMLLIQNMYGDLQCRIGLYHILSGSLIIPLNLRL
jgi:hypothetical protein